MRESANCCGTRRDTHTPGAGFAGVVESLRHRNMLRLAVEARKASDIAKVACRGTSMAYDVKQEKLETLVRLGMRVGPDRRKCAPRGGFVTAYLPDGNLLHMKVRDSK